jgi:hypothetical protein
VYAVDSPARPEKSKIVYATLLGFVPVILMTRRSSGCDRSRYLLEKPGIDDPTSRIVQLEPIPMSPMPNT